MRSISFLATRRFSPRPGESAPLRNHGGLCTTLSFTQKNATEYGAHYAKVHPEIVAAICENNPTSKLNKERRKVAVAEAACAMADGEPIMTGTHITEELRQGFGQKPQPRVFPNPAFLVLVFSLDFGFLHVTHVLLSFMPARSPHAQIGALKELP